jgi:lactaldehyde dehydrogenase/glycolaldehyde dehydrogenase
MKTAAKNITKVNLELGGKAPAIVCKDADVAQAAKLVAASRTLNTGQVCNAADASMWSARSPTSSSRRWPIR